MIAATLGLGNSTNLLSNFINLACHFAPRRSVTIHLCTPRTAWIESIIIEQSANPVKVRSMASTSWVHLTWAHGKMYISCLFYLLQITSYDGDDEDPVPVSRKYVQHKLSKLLFYVVRQSRVDNRHQTPPLNGNTNHSMVWRRTLPCRKVPFPRRFRWTVNNRKMSTNHAASRVEGRMSKMSQVSVMIKILGGCLDWPLAIEWRWSEIWFLMWSTDK